MSASAIKQQYISLAGLLKRYRSTPIDSDLLKSTHEFCARLYELGNSSPDLLFAQPQLYKSRLAYSLNLSFNACVYTCLLGMRNQVDENSSIQLMCAAISIYAFEQADLERFYNPTEALPTAVKIGRKHPELSKLLSTHKQALWLAAYELCTQIHRPIPAQAAQLNTIVAIAMIANKLALLGTTNLRKKPLSFAQSIQQLSLGLPAKYYALLSPLLIYPGLSPPGSYIKDGDSRLYVVLALTAKGLLAKPLPIKQALSQSPEADEINLLTEQQIQHRFAPQNCNGFGLLDKWWNSDLDTWLEEVNTLRLQPNKKLLSITSPPAALLVIQDQLTRANTDISILIKIIEQQPSYAQHLQLAATSNNRRKQQVTNIQHSLAMLGHERTKGLLLEHCLLSRLTQQQFVLRPAFLAFSQLLALFNAQLARSTGLCSAELASSSGYFMLSRLFTLPSLRKLVVWQPKAGRSFDIAHLVEAKGSAQLKRDGVLIAKAWQQDKIVLAALAYDSAADEPHNKTGTRQLSYLLGLSLLLARETYFGSTQRCSDTLSFIDSACLHLKLKEQKLYGLSTQIHQEHNISTPLTYT